MYTADFVSAPNLTAAAAAQNLTWAPVSVTAVAVSSYSLVMPTSSSALLTITLTADLGVSGDILSVAPDASTSGRRRLVQSSSGKPMLTDLSNLMLTSRDQGIVKVAFPSQNEVLAPVRYDQAALSNPMHVVSALVLCDCCLRVKCCSQLFCLQWRPACSCKQ